MAEFANTLWTNDNLYVLNGMNSESVDLIYLDPPFNTGQGFSAKGNTKIGFEDTWQWPEEHQDLRWELWRFDPKIAGLIDSIAEINGLMQ